MTRTRVGLIGCGFIGMRHLRNLLGFEDVDVVAVADPAEGCAAEAARDSGARVHADHAALLASEDLDAVFICVPPFAHGPPEHAALDRGLPFFVEKPVSADLETAEGIAERVEALGATTAVGYHWRHLDTVQAARDLTIRHPPRVLVGQWLDATPPPAWWLVEARSGGQLVEQATHLFDLARLLAGEVVRVYAAGSRAERRAFRDADVHDVSAATLEFASGAVATIAATCVLGWPHRIVLEVISEGLSIELTERDMRITGAEGPTASSAAVDPYRCEAREFLDAVRHGGSVRVPYGQALATHRVVAAAARSARERAPVELPVLARADG